MKLSDYLAGCLSVAIISIMWWLGGWNFNTRDTTAVTWFVASVFAFVWISYSSKMFRELDELNK